MAELLNNIGFDWQIALANFVNFLIIFWILKKYVFGPVGKIIAERTEKIQLGIDQAQQSETELLVAQQKGEKEIKVAQRKANTIIAQAHERADEYVASAKHVAQQEADGILEKAHEQIGKDKLQAEKELLQDTARLITVGVEKILNEEMNDEHHSRVKKRALATLKERP